MPAPAFATQLLPAVVIAGLSAYVDQTIDRTGAADHFSAGPENGAVCETFVRFCLKTPVSGWIADGLEVTDRNMDPRVGSRAAGLNEEHRNGGVLR